MPRPVDASKPSLVSVAAVLASGGKVTQDRDLAVASAQDLLSVRQGLPEQVIAWPGYDVASSVN
jgi:hypothetical protein